MSRSKKIVLGALVLVLVIAASVAGTVAYLTSTPEEVKNTFTIGKVVIDLDEAPTDEYGVVDSTATGRVKTNDYKLVPGHEYAKDPTVHVDPASESCFVFVKVENEIAGLEAANPSTGSATKIADQILAKGWTALGTSAPGVYYKSWAAGSTTVDLVVFEKFVLATDADLSTLTPTTGSTTNAVDEVIKITAYAIQADGFADAAAAWTAGGF